MNRPKTIAKWLIFLAAMLLLTPAHAAPKAQTCGLSETQLQLQYLRRLSLDLKGQLPSYDELWAVIQKGKVTDQMIVNMLKSDEMLREIEAYHTRLLWLNLDNRRLAPGSWSVGGNGTTIPFHLTLQGRKRRYRGGNVVCLNEPATYNADGSIAYKEKKYTLSNGRTETIRQEGYVMVKPYWAPTKEYKVCAFDAQTTAYTKTTTPLHCSKVSYRQECGCGPNMRWCQRGTTTQRLITRSMTQQVLRYARTIVKENRPYSDLILGRDIEVNGPLSHWYRYQTETGGGFLFATKEQNFNIPTVPFLEQNTWVKVKERGYLHSGVLTLPGFLLKFESNRSRANRFYHAFLCQHFQAPAGGLPAADSECHNEPNLTKRCGCNFCHKAVEPAAAYWGRWAEAGISPLNPKQFPERLAKCETPQGARSLECRRLYFTRPNHPEEAKYKGMLNAYVFADEHMKNNIALGPRGIAHKAVSLGKFADCTTKKIWGWLVGPVIPQQEAKLKQMAQQFRKDKHNLLNLIKTIVTSNEYRYGRLLNR